MLNDAISAGHEVRPDDIAAVDAALDVLLDAELEPIVDMVCTRRDGVYEALAHDGRVRFRRDGAGGYEVLDIEGAHPLSEPKPSGSYAKLVGCLPDGVCARLLKHAHTVNL